MSEGQHPLVQVEKNMEKTAVSMYGSLEKLHEANMTFMAALAGFSRAVAQMEERRKSGGAL